MPNKFSQIWQELKRRNVVRVITVYAGAAFVLLELVDIIKEPLKLPDWLLPAVIVLLTVGFIIAAILSWIYDIHPEGGMVKTEPFERVKAEDIPKSSNSWKIASYISFAVILGLIILNIIPRTGKKEVLDKSIAVLPFRNDSPEQTEMYFIDGTMESILDNLCKIKDLRVVSRSSVEQYRDNPIPIPAVGVERNVSYVVEGSGLRHGDNIRLTIQLIDAVNDRHLWSNTYNRKAEEIFDLQSDIAQLVAKEIEIIITPEEQQLLQKKPTTSLSAHSYYLKGRELVRKYEPEEGDIYFLNEAERLFNLALEHDPTYSKAYVGAGEVYYWYVKRYLNLRKRDSVQLISDTIIELTDLALKYDPQNSEAFNLRGNYYYWLKNNHSKALEAYEKALDYNPNDHIAQHYVGLLSNDLLKALMSTHESLLRDNSEFIDESLEGLVEIYSVVGFPEKANYYATELLSINHDSASYYDNLSWIAYHSWNINECLSYAEKAMQLDSTSNWINYLWFLHRARNYKRIYADFLKPYESDYYNGDLIDLNPYFKAVFPAHLGMYYWYQGDTAKAKSLLLIQIESMNQLFTKLDVWGHSSRDALDHGIELSSVTGDIDNAFHLFRQFQDISSNFDVYRWGYYISFKMSPRFANISQESWFQDAIHEWESELTAEHERIRQWLEENEML